MKKSLIKRKSHDLVIKHDESDSAPSVWGKRSFIHPFCKEEMFKGLLAFTKEHMLQQQQEPSLNIQIKCPEKCDEKDNPFQMVKAKLIAKKKQSLNTCDSSGKEQASEVDDFPPIEMIKSDEMELVTWKQVNQTSVLRKRDAVQCLTDRTNKF